MVCSPPMSSCHLPALLVLYDLDSSEEYCQVNCRQGDVRLNTCGGSWALTRDKFCELDGAHQPGGKTRAEKNQQPGGTCVGLPSQRRNRTRRDLV